MQKDVSRPVECTPTIRSGGSKKRMLTEAYRPSNQNAPLKEVVSCLDVGITGVGNGTSGDKDGNAMDTVALGTTAASGTMRHGCIAGYNFAPQRGGESGVSWSCGWQPHITDMPHAYPLQATLRHQYPSHGMPMPYGVPIPQQILSVRHMGVGMSSAAAGRLVPQWPLPPPPGHVSFPSPAADGDVNGMVSASTSDGDDKECARSGRGWRREGTGRGQR